MPERTGWRDEEISRRHRVWGANIHAVDVDFLLIEHYTGNPAALVEYKHHLAFVGPPNETNINYQAIIKLAQRAWIPFLVVYYWPDIWAFRVYPMNEEGYKHFSPGQELSEAHYVRKMFEIRGQVIEDYVIRDLRTDFVPTG